MLLIFIGVGVILDNWLSLTVIVLPMTAALLHRIQIEENALVELLGSDYTNYRQTTKPRLLPGIY